MTILLPSTEIDPWRTASASLCRGSRNAGCEDLRNRVGRRAMSPHSIPFATGTIQHAVCARRGRSSNLDQWQDKKRRMLRHTVRRVGAVTGALDSGDIGMPLGLRGPFGEHGPLMR